VFVLNWRDNKGYTLVELVISMAILALVSLTIASLMKTGTTTYKNAKSELDVQMDSQTLLAQINTMIMEANQVSYDSANQVLALYKIKQERVALPMPSDGSSSTPQYTTNKTVTDIKVIKLDSAAKRLYLKEEDHDIVLPASGGSLSFDADEELFSEYMDSFDVDVDGSNVTVTIGMKSGKQKYKASATTKIRNGLVSYP
jgi:prepilin-type N-terminal cleavage/methylation domain-containing protein